MSKQMIQCPNCGYRWETFKNPLPTVDVIIERWSKAASQPEIVLIRRKNPPPGWALPGGFVDYGETVEAAAIREAIEETGLEVELIHLLGVYSRPDRDERFHTISTVFVARATGDIQAGDDAADAKWFPIRSLPEPLAFDHADIIRDYIQWREMAGFQDE
ncbi:MAG: NUDIX hydrolase [candidate division KSB1 bacterium]|nr:NUDIX hydrolase [candidate division KSB1 bacterium]MDQ7062745.1 NUDIX hydrolase [candidate division KSB1 bacterium]